MSLTSISKGKKSNDYNAPNTVKTAVIPLCFLYFYEHDKVINVNQNKVNIKHTYKKLYKI